MAQPRSGSDILLEKLAIYSQCKANMETPRDESEGNSLLGDALHYNLLALARGVHAAAPFTESHRDVETLVKTLGGPFHAIHRNASLSSSSSQSVWWLTHHTEEEEGAQSDLIHRERALFSEAVGLPLYTHVVLPSLSGASTHPQRDGKKKKRGGEDDRSVLGIPFKRLRSEDSPKTLCRYGSALLAHCLTSTPEANVIMKALRTASAPHQGNAKYQQQGNTKSPNLSRLIQRIKESTVSHVPTSSREERDDASAVHAYLKRRQWIADQFKASQSGSGNWMSLTEGERVALEMKHTSAERARFSRQRRANK